MNLDVREVGGVAVLDLSGKLTRGDGDTLLRDTLDHLLGAGQTRLVINLMKVPYMDSGGIGELMASHQRAQAAGGSVKLLNPHKRVYDVLQVVKLDTVFEIFKDEGAALDSFRDEGSPA